MYVNDPGVYYNAHGVEVRAELAEAAGFPVTEQLREHKIKVALHAAQQEVLEKFGAVKKEIVAERAGFKIKTAGVGTYVVLAPDGAVLTQPPIPLEQAEILLKNLAPEAEQPKKK